MTNKFRLLVLSLLFAPLVSFSEDYVSAHIDACNAGDAKECSKVATMYELALGVKDDMQMAFNFYKKSCDGDIAKDCTHLGDFYLMGAGTDKDPVLAREFYLKGCSLAHAEGCRNSGYMNELGEGGATDLNKALALFKKALDLDLKDAASDIERVKAKLQN